MQFCEYAVPVVQCLWVYGILEELHQHRHVDDGSEDGVASCLVFGFFHIALLFDCFLFIFV